MCKNYLCTPPVACRKLGETCGSTGECCDGVCLNYVCKTAPKCKAIGEWCYSNSECCTKKCKLGECSEYVGMMFVEIRGSQTFEQGKGGVFTAFGKYESGEEENVSVTWMLDGSVGKFGPANGTNITYGKSATFLAEKVGVGVIRIAYSDGVKTITNFIPITIMAGPAVRIEIFYDKSLVHYGETVEFTYKGYDKGGNPTSVSPSDIAWTANGGSVDQRGMFIAPKKSGNFTVTAKYDDYSTTAAIEVIPDKVNEASGLSLEAIMAQVYALIGQIVLAAVLGVAALVILYIALRRLRKMMERFFSMPPLPPGSSVLIEAPPESNADNNAYEIISRELRNGGKALVLTLKPDESEYHFKKKIRSLEKVKIVGVEPDLTKVGIKLSELIESEKFSIVYFSFFAKVALAQGADSACDFVEFNMQKLKKAGATGIFPVELNEKLASEFLSKLEMSADVVIEHKVVDREYAMIKQWKGEGVGKEWLPFK
jgi:hypothetical protein